VNFKQISLYIYIHFSVLQRVRGSATIGLCYVNPTSTLARTGSTESANTQANEVRNFFCF